MTAIRFLAPLFAAATLTGCINVMNNRPTGVSSIPCTYRFKALSRPEDQSRVEAAIHSVAVGSVVKAGTVSYPEYRFRVARMADLDRLHPQLLFNNPQAFIPSTLRQSLNLRGGGVDMTFDSTDVSASATLTLTFAVKPGSRLYYKNPGGYESDITARVDKKGRVVLPVTVKEGQRYLYARAMKDNVVRYIRINIFTNHVEDIPKHQY